jgi:hypothetical protein
MNLITGYFGKPHISTNQDSMWHRGIWKDDCIIDFNENLKADIISNNEIQVKSGILNMQGRFAEVPINTYDSLSINNGTVGENRIDLIVCHYEKNADTKVESTTLKVIQGTPSTSTPSVPSYTEGNIDNGDLVAELPVFRVNIEGINIVGVDNLIDTVPAFTDMNPTLLFQGTISNGSLTLNESTSNYRVLAIGISSESGGGAFAWSLIPILPNSSLLPGYQAIMGYNGGVDDSGKNYISTYCGRIKIDESGTQVTFVQQITNVSHASGKAHTGGSKYSITYVYGIR